MTNREFNIYIKFLNSAVTDYAAITVSCDDTSNQCIMCSLSQYLKELEMNLLEHMAVYSRDTDLRYKYARTYHALHSGF